MIDHFTSTGGLTKLAIVRLFCVRFHCLKYPAWNFRSVTYSNEHWHLCFTLASIDAFGLLGVWCQSILSRPLSQRPKMRLGFQVEREVFDDKGLGDFRHFHLTAADHETASR